MGMEMQIEYIIRLLLSILCGGLIGAERELRQKNAGVKTHVVVALASALMMIVSKYGFYDVLPVDGISVDASRIAAGVVSAIGFLGAGVIFVRRDSAMGITTAAGLWATVGVGIALGAGMYEIAVIATLMIMVVQIVLHSRHLRLISPVAGSIKVDLTASGMTVSEIRSHLASAGVSFRGFSLRKSEDGHMIFSAYIMLSARRKHTEQLEFLEKAEYIAELEIHSV